MELSSAACEAYQVLQKTTNSVWLIHGVLFQVVGEPIGQSGDDIFEGVQVVTCHQL